MPQCFGPEDICPAVIFLDDGEIVPEAACQDRRKRPGCHQQQQNPQSGFRLETCNAIGGEQCKPCKHQPETAGGRYAGKTVALGCQRRRRLPDEDRQCRETDQRSGEFQARRKPEKGDEGGDNNDGDEEGSSSNRKRFEDRSRFTLNDPVSSECHEGGRCKRVEKQARNQHAYLVRPFRQIPLPGS